MPRRKKPAYTQADIERLRNLIAALEEIRLKRKAIRKRRRLGKQFTLAEMYEIVPTYHNAKYRPDETFPLSRDEIIALSDYLECTSNELNSILLIARYEPIDRYIPIGSGFERCSCNSTGNDEIFAATSPRYHP
jgi:hypothetical protein